MKPRLLWAALFLMAAAFVAAEPRAAAGSDLGPRVVLVSAAEGAVNLLHEGSVVRGWLFYGPFTAAVVLAGALDTVEWTGDEAVVAPGGADPLATARAALEASPSPRLVLVNFDGASQVLRAPEGEQDMDYDAASAATEE